MARKGRSMFQGMGATMIALRNMLKKQQQDRQELIKLRKQIKAKPAKAKKERFVVKNGKNGKNVKK